MSKITITMLVSMLVNIFLSIIKIIVGLIGKSGALLADGFHSLSDLVTDVVAIIGGILSRKPADKNHPYGHGKIEYITSIFISIMILILGSTIISKAFITQVKIPSKIVIIVTFITIIVKYLLSSYIIRCGKKYNSNILISSGYESRTDVISSVVVLVSSILVIFEDKVKVLRYADKTAMVIVGLLILKTGLSLLKENISNIIGEREENIEYIKNVENIIMSFKEVKIIDDLNLIKYGSYYKLITDIGMNKNMKLKDVHEVIDKIEGKIKKETSIKFITIHVNPY